MLRRPRRLLRSKSIKELGIRTETVEPLSLQGWDAKIVSLLEAVVALCVLINVSRLVISSKADFPLSL